MAFGNGPRIVTSGLVLALDASDKNSYPGSGTTWRDLSGNNNSGSLVNGPTFNSANGGSIVFDGTDDYVDCGNASSVNLTSAITTSAWIKKPHATNYQAIIDKGRDNFGAWTFALNETTTPAATWHVRISGVNRIIIANTNYGNNIWTFITGTFDGTTLSIYQNGVLSNSANYSGTIGTNAISVRVGAANDTGYLSGNIAIAQIYNRALSATEIQQNYDAQKSRFNLI